MMKMKKKVRKIFAWISVMVLAGVAVRGVRKAGRRGN